MLRGVLLIIGTLVGAQVCGDNYCDTATNEYAIPCYIDCGECSFICGDGLCSSATPLRKRYDSNVEMPSNASLNRRLGSLRKEVQELRQALVATNQRLDACCTLQSPSCSSFAVDIKQEEVEYNFDNYSPDTVQDYMPSILRDEQAKGKLVVITFQQDFVHGIASPNDLDVPEGTLRSFKNGGVNELFAYMQGIGDRILRLQPGEQGSLVFRGGAWEKN